MTARWPHGDPRDVARAIVADPRYVLHVAPVPASPPSWIDVVRDWLVQQLRRLLHGLDRALGAHSGLETVLGALLIVAAFALLAYIVYRLVLSALRPRRRSRAFASEGAGERGESAALLRDRAIAAARAGRYRDAAALLFASAVRELDERGRLAYDAARTPGEYRRMLRDPAFDALAADAVVALFAASEPREELWDRMQRSYDRYFTAPAPS